MTESEEYNAYAGSTDGKNINRMKSKKQKRKSIDVPKPKNWRGVNGPGEKEKKIANIYNNDGNSDMSADLFDDGPSTPRNRKLAGLSRMGNFKSSKTMRSSLNMSLNQSSGGV